MKHSHSVLSTHAWPLGLSLLLCMFLLQPSHYLHAQSQPVNASQLTSIHDIQYTTSASGDSPMEGDVVTVRGIVTATYYNGFIVADDEGPWNAIFVYTYNAGPDIGHKVQFSATVSEYWGLTELSNVTNYTLLSVKHPNHIRPVVVPVQLARSEAYESVLVTCENVTVTGFPSHPYYYNDDWQITDNSGSMLCNYANDYTYYPQLNDQLDAVTGIVRYEFSDFRLMPRSTQDIESTLIPHYAIKGIVVTMNKQRRIIMNGYVEIHGNDIVKVSQNRPACDIVLEVDGYILPGLIDAHNHPYYNVFGVIPFAIPPYFSHRDQWAETALYDEFKVEYNDVHGYSVFYPGIQTLNIVKWGELRALCAGTTTWQGTNPNEINHDEHYAAQGIGINNAERFPARSKHIVFPTSKSSIPQWPTWLNQYWDRFIIHLSEGTDAYAYAQFQLLDQAGIMDERFSIIHGVALGASDFAKMAAVNSKLIWSPQSNVALYGATADVPAALNAGVTVALGADWTESGSFNLLDEMRFAKNWSQSHWNNLLTSEDLVEFVTVNAADALGLSDRIGSIEEGKQADLVVIPKLSNNPYDDVLQAYEDDVMLTVVSGSPMYGDANLMQAFPFLFWPETINLCGTAKTVAWAIPSHYSLLAAMPVSQMETELIAAYSAASIKPAPFLHYDRCAPPVPKQVRPEITLPEHMLILAQNYPNPFNPTTTITFTVPVDGSVQLTVHDVLGRTLATLVDEHRRAGQYTEQFDAAALPSGTYLCRLTFEGETQTKWMTLAR
ncbi:amidohydrolase family protein [bacterium]|nr:amidohydrolase family protein [bacterium]